MNEQLQFQFTAVIDATPLKKPALVEGWREGWAVEIAHMEMLLMLEREDEAELW